MVYFEAPDRWLQLCGVRKLNSNLTNSLRVMNESQSVGHVHLITIMRVKYPLEKGEEQGCN